MTDRAFCYAGHRYKMLGDPVYRAAIENLTATGLTDEQAARRVEETTITITITKEILDGEMTVESVEPRYKVVKGSQSSHCCFEWSVVDTHDTEYRSEGQAVCECFEHKDAAAICTALELFRVEAAREVAAHG